MCWVKGWIKKFGIGGQKRRKRGTGLVDSSNAIYL